MCESRGFFITPGLFVLGLFVLGLFVLGLFVLGLFVLGRGERVVVRVSRVSSTHSDSPAKTMVKPSDGNVSRPDHTETTSKR